MGRILGGGAIIVIGLLYLGAVSLVLFGTGTSASAAPGLTGDDVFAGLLLLPVGLAAIGAGLSVLLRGRRDD